MKFKYSDESWVLPSSIDTRRILISTNSSPVDNFFNGGIMPGGVYCVDGTAGTGKTTFLLQLLQSIKSTYIHSRVGFISSEQHVREIALACLRLNVDIPITNRGYSSDIINEMEKVDILAIDSFSALRDNTPSSMYSLIQSAKETSTTLFIILQQTKNGQYRGSSDIIHAVDGHFTLTNDPEVADCVKFTWSKNRYGSIKLPLRLKLQSSGYSDFIS